MTLKLLRRVVNANRLPSAKLSLGSIQFVHDLLLVAFVLFAWLSATIGFSLLIESIWHSQGQVLLRNTILPLALAHATTWLIIWKIFTSKGKANSYAQAGFINFSQTRYLMMLLSGMLTHFLLAFGLAFLPLPPPPISPIKQLIEQGGLSIIAVFVMTVAMAPLLEETLFRGLLQSTLRKKISPLPTMIIVSLIFTIPHTLSFGLYWPALVIIMIASLILCYLRERYQSLWYPIFFHAGFNLLSFLLLLANKSINT